MDQLKKKAGSGIRNQEMLPLKKTGEIWVISCRK